MTTFLWLVVLAGGPLLIALVLAYVMLRSKKLTGVEKQARDRAIKDMYEERDADQIRTGSGPMSR
jgi:hypothetical protein